MNRLSKVVDQLKPQDNSSRENNRSDKPKKIYNPNDNNSNNKSKYRYTLDNYADEMFSKEQRDFYEENGYIVIRKLFNEDEVSYYWNRFEELVKNPKLRPPSMLVMRDITEKGLNNDQRTSEEKVVKLQDWSREEGLWKYPTQNTIKKYVRAFCGDNVRAMHFMVINKPPDTGHLSSRHPFHQDQWYFPYAPSDHIVCSWTALMPIDRNNGCLAVVPGSHKREPGGKLLKHGYPEHWHGPVNKAYHGVLDTDINKVLRKRIHLEMKAGDTVFFHPLLLHASGANLSNKSRRSISVHFASSTLCDFFDFEHAGQKIIAEEVEGMAKDKYGLNASFEMVWRGKSRQVEGNAGNLGLLGQ